MSVEGTASKAKAQAPNTVTLRNMTGAAIKMPKWGKLETELAPGADTDVAVPYFHAAGGDTSFAEQIASGNICVVHAGSPTLEESCKVWQDAKTAKEAAKKVKPDVAPVAAPAKPEEK